MWRSHGALKSNAGYHGYATRKIFEFQRSRMTKTVTFLPWWQPFNSFCFEILSFLILFFCHTKKWGAMPPATPWCRQPCINAHIPFELIMTYKLREKNKANTFLSVFRQFIWPKFKVRTKKLPTVSLTRSKQCYKNYNYFCFSLLSLFFPGSFLLYVT